MSDMYCEVCNEQIEPGDMVLHAYNTVDANGEAWQREPSGVGPPYVHLRCVANESDTNE